MNAFDTDGDVRLNLDEYAALSADAMREDIVDSFQTHDDDGDGRVTLDEYNSRVARERSTEDAAALAATRGEQHAAFDADGDSVLALAEYELLWLDAMRPRMVDQFQSHDADGDAIVTADEFSARWVGIFERLDRDGNGMVNDDDLEAIRDGDREGRGWMRLRRE